MLMLTKPACLAIASALALYFFNSVERSNTDLNEKFELLLLPPENLRLFYQTYLKTDFLSFSRTIEHLLIGGLRILPNIFCCLSHWILAA